MTVATHSRLSLPLSVSTDRQLAELQLVELCKAGADTLRLRVLRLLKRDAMEVSTLCALLDVRQPALSHHLKLMSNAGLLESQRDGNHIFYRRRELLPSGELGALQHALFAAADALPMDDPTQQRLTALQARRERHSREFFRDFSKDQNAARFRARQDLIAGSERYAQAVVNALDTLEATNSKLAVEIGPGDGWLLPELSRRFGRVVALDNAPEMLEQAKAKVREEALTNVELRLGDTADSGIAGLAADLAVLNMVLHHTPDPGGTLHDTAAALAPGGALLVTELCEHGQGWARESCGDLWLGFEPEQIQAWAAAAGLVEVAGDYLAQRNGFKLQVRLFSAPQKTT
jgi:ArsR family transcriptional regulator